MRRRRRFTGNRLSRQEQLELRRRVADGSTHSSVAETMKCSTKTVQRLVVAAGGLRPRDRPRSPLRLSPAEREEISRGLRAGRSLRQIAHQLSRAPSTVSREVKGNGGRARYRAWRAEDAANQHAKRPKPTKLAVNTRLRREVSRGLTMYWSPEQICSRLRVDFPDEPEMRVSPETVYRSLYVQGRGALRKELRACLRSGRAQRKPHGRGTSVSSGRLRDMVMVSDRPPEAMDRAVPGHWEGDLILGRNGRSAVATLVERTTRFVMLVRLGADRTAELVATALAQHVQTLPAQLRRSLTWDQGKEMAAHLRFSIETGIPVYFCDPYSPWQRGSNENTNGLLRQYLPRTADLATYSQARLDEIASELNGRPRQTLDWMTPSEKLEEVLR